MKYLEWPWVFFIVIPVAVIALLMAMRNIPAHINETTEKVDNFGGILSVILVGAFVLALNFITIAEYQTMAYQLLGVFLIATIIFIIRQRKAKYPLYDLNYAKRPTFWVAAVAGIIIFGSLWAPCSSDSNTCRTCLPLGRSSRPFRRSLPGHA